MRKLDWSACGARVTQVGAEESKELLLLGEAFVRLPREGKGGGMHLKSLYILPLTWQHAA